jgi:hypothetical protein
MKFIRYITIIGNVLFVLWLLANGIDEGFRAAPAELASYIFLFGLLALNTWLILKRK